MLDAGRKTVYEIDPWLGTTWVKNQQISENDENNIWISYPDIFRLKPNKYLKANSDILFDPQYEIYKLMFKSTFNIDIFCSMLRKECFL